MKNRHPKQILEDIQRLLFQAHTRKVGSNHLLEEEINELTKLREEAIKQPGALTHELDTEIKHTFNGHSVTPAYRACSKQLIDLDDLEIDYVIGVRYLTRTASTIRVRACSLEEAMEKTEENTDGDEVLVPGEGEGDLGSSGEGVYDDPPEIWSDTLPEPETPKPDNVALEHIGILKELIEQGEIHEALKRLDILENHICPHHG